ncbi:MAG: hypothetical protein NTU59_09700 [Coprothermobacterota bacterium]|nr:hypothetical protein [Coprothermobacterota bacterium]
MFTVCTRTETAVSHHSCRSCSPKEARKKIAIMTPIGYTEFALIEQPAIALLEELG